MHQCHYCKYESIYKYNVDRLEVAKHKQLKTKTYQAHATHHNQSRAPTTISVGHDGGQAQTTYRAPGPEVGWAPTTNQPY